MKTEKIIERAKEHFDKFAVEPATLYINVSCPDNGPWKGQMHAEPFDNIDDAALEATDNDVLYTIYVNGMTAQLIDLESHGSRIMDEMRAERRDAEQYVKDVSSLELAGRV